ncbi:hypothetical protein [Devosia sp.]|uniref:hypothetical protein n=1 Tax=Devosia sp. TaxID=1871048 RepID=UPI002FC87C62
MKVDAQVQPGPAGMPGVEDVARVISPYAWEELDRSAYGHQRLGALNSKRLSAEAAQRVLDLFAPLAQENERLKAERDNWQAKATVAKRLSNDAGRDLAAAEARATSAEARVAQAVEAGYDRAFAAGRAQAFREAAESLKIEAGALYSETAHWKHFAETSMLPGEEASLAEGLRLINERAKKLNAAIEALAKP